MRTKARKGGEEPVYGSRHTEVRRIERRLNTLGVCKACTQKEIKKRAGGPLYLVFKEEYHEKKAQNVASSE